MLESERHGHIDILDAENKHNRVSPTETNEQSLSLQVVRLSKQNLDLLPAELSLCNQ